MIPEELKSMITFYPGSPVTTAAIEALYKRRVPPEVAKDQTSLEALIGAWEAETPAAVPKPATAAGRSPAVRQQGRAFYGDGLCFYDGLVNASFFGRADVSVPATVSLSGSTSGSYSFRVGCLDDDYYDTVDELAEAIGGLIDNGNGPDMELDDDSLDTDDIDTGLVDLDYSNLTVDEFRDEEPAFGASDLHDLAEWLVENGIVRLAQEDEDDN